jgi:chromosome partitioning protein
METDVPGVWLVPSARELMSFEIDFSPRAGSELYLVERLGQDAEPYDYLIFDPPPTVGLLTVSALVAAKEVYIPMPMHFLAMEGLAEMMRLIYTVNANWNRELKMMGVIPTFYNSTTRIAREITADIAQNFGPSKLLPGIRMNVSLAEAPGHGKSVMEYAPKSSGALDYMALADHIDRGAAQ